MQATEQYFHVVLFTMLYKAFDTFPSVDKTLKEMQLSYLTSMVFENCQKARLSSNDSVLK